MKTREAWLSFVEEVKEKGSSYTDEEGRQCKELQNRVLTVPDPSDAADVVRELQRTPDWVYPSVEELRSIMMPTGKQDTHIYSYADRLFGTDNQIDGFVIPLLKQQPTTRRAVAVLFKPEIDAKTTSKAVPALLTVHFRLHKQLEVTCHIRSSDVLIGLPANIFQIRTLQEYVAEKLSVQPGAIHVLCTSAHYFTEYNEIYAHITKVIKKERRSA